RSPLVSVDLAYWAVGALSVVRSPRTFRTADHAQVFHRVAPPRASERWSGDPFAVPLVALPTRRVRLAQSQLGQLYLQTAGPSRLPQSDASMPTERDACPSKSGISVGIRS